MGDYEAKPARWRHPPGDYKPPQPYIRPGSDHSHMPHSYEDDMAKKGTLEALSPTDRRALIVQKVDTKAYSRGELVTELNAAHAKTVDNALAQLRADGTVVTQTVFNNGLRYLSARLAETRGVNPVNRDAAAPAADSPPADEKPTEAERTCPDCKGEGEAPRSLAGACVPCPTCDATGQLAEATEAQPDDRSRKTPRAARDQYLDDEAVQEREEIADVAAFAPLTADQQRELNAAMPPARVEPVTNGIDRLAVSHEGCLLLWVDGQLIEIDNPTTRGIHKMLDLNAALVNG
ncbi:hypothetical protein J2T57_002637 [Natronocella acetinitrilica]|uniref:Uncharacterized protein n=1 Tax=Natronocella acetinitrilica TaxID=414046 RepID=A0AAE3KGQ5_9GAMM|nr:hypothetical protein [Natronocella acetinitrilica]MCP1675487.1 hypothetical protein [Natronocella acetinitrilica]